MRKVRSLFLKVPAYKFLKLTEFRSSICLKLIKLCNKVNGTQPTFLPLRLEFGNNLFFVIGTHILDLLLASIVYILQSFHEYLFLPELLLLECLHQLVLHNVAPLTLLICQFAHAQVELSLDDGPHQRKELEDIILQSVLLGDWDLHDFVVDLHDFVGTSDQHQEGEL